MDIMSIMLYNKGGGKMDKNNKDLKKRDIAQQTKGDNTENSDNPTTEELKCEGGENMQLLQEKSISATKQDFPNLAKLALKGFEVIAGNFKSKTKDTVSIISTNDLLDILKQGFKFNLVVEQEEEGFTIALDEIMVFGYGETLKEAFDDLVTNSIDYAKLYLEKVDFYRQIPNRHNHLPYLRRIASCSNRQQVMEVITECHSDLLQEILKQ